MRLQPLCVFSLSYDADGLRLVRPFSEVCVPESEG
jgi:hypothetical protein